MSWKVEKLTIPGPLLLTPERVEDARGWQMASYDAIELAEAIGRDVDFLQDLEVFSEKTGTLRGLHFQHPPFDQAKLIRVVQGAIRDVVVDIRDGSPTFGQHAHVDLDDKMGQQLWVPEGFAQGMVSRRVNTLVSYKVTAGYTSRQRGRILWNDPLLHIDWGVSDPILSEKDARATSFADLVSPFGLRMS